MNRAKIKYKTMLKKKLLISLNKSLWKLKRRKEDQCKIFLEQKAIYFRVHQKYNDNGTCIIKFL
jgi:hypothetical protein